MRVPVIERDDYTIWFQPYEDADGEVITFIHCEIHNRWTKQVKLAVAADYAQLRDMTRQAFYTLSEPTDTKHHKFLTIFGFKHHKDVQLGDGSVKHIFISEK